MSIMTKIINRICVEFDNVNYHDSMEVTEDEVHLLIGKLSTGKAAGPDRLTAEHIKYVKDVISKPLSMLFSCIIVHGYVPQPLMDSVITPIVKNKNLTVKDKSNYRPIALSSVVSKLLELLLQSRMVDYLYTTDNQFGFKEALGTELCIYTLKECLSYYNRMGSNMFVCAMDASAAFDKLPFTTLFQKLLERNVPVYIVRLLFYWYFRQKMCVRWNSTLSNKFRVTNGVRQGGILSPQLFNIYMYDLSVCLNSKVIGCCINNVRL